MVKFISKALNGQGAVGNRLVKETVSTYVYLIKVGDLYVERIERDSVQLTKHIGRACKFNYNIETPKDKEDFCKYILERTEVLDGNYTIVEHVVETNIYETPVEVTSKYGGQLELVSTELLRRQQVKAEQEASETVRGEVPLKVTDGIIYRPREEDGLVVAINSKGEQLTAEETNGKSKFDLNTEPPELDDWSKF